MGARENNRLWLLGGLIAIVVIVAATYLLLIKPVYTDKSEVQGQAADQDVQLVELKHQLNDLKAQAAEAGVYRAQLADRQAALPQQYDLPAYLRALQASEKSVTVDISSVGVTLPQKVDGSATVFSVPITLTVSGKPADITRVIKRIQVDQSRAVLITSVNLSVTNESKANADVVFVAFCRTSDKCVAAA